MFSPPFYDFVLGLELFEMGVSLYNPETHHVGQASLKLRETYLPCCLIAGIKGTYHHTQLLSLFFLTDAPYTDIESPIIPQYKPSI